MIINLNQCLLHINMRYTAANHYNYYRNNSMTNIVIIRLTKTVRLYDVTVDFDWLENRKKSAMDKANASSVTCAFAFKFVFREEGTFEGAKIIKYDGNERWSVLEI